MRVSSVAALLLAILAVPAYAHHCRHHHGCRDCAPQQSSSEQSALKGTISEVIYLPGSGSVEVVLETGAKTARVKLAPSRFLTDNGVGLKEGQPFEAKGFWVDTTGGELFVATEVSSGAGMVRLRDSRGRPRW